MITEQQPAEQAETSELAYEIAQRIYAEESVLGQSPTYEELVGKHYRIHPVDPETFLFDKAYAGQYGKGLYKKWQDELIEVLDPANGITEWILTGAIGIGKSTVAALALCYKLYRLGCLIDPANFFNLMADSNVVFGVYSLFKYKSQDDNYDLLKKMIDGIPFFRNTYPRPKHRSASAKDDLSFPNDVRVIFGSTELHALGLNLLCLLMDEVNFMKEQEKAVTNQRTSVLSEKVSQAQELYTASKRRLESRFQYRGVTPGLMILISSRNAESSWLERHMAEVEGHTNVKISDYPLWDVKQEVMGYSGKRFFVEVGDFLNPSRIIDSPKNARPDARVVAPPVEHEDEFKLDIEGALRDIAGVANIAISPLIRDRASLAQAIDPKLTHPFRRQQFPVSHLDDIPIKSHFTPKQILKIVRSFPRPLLNPESPRYIHVDLAETQDAAGFAMGHISKVQGTDPHISMDLMLRILAPDKGEIDFSKIVDFVLYLHQECGYPIKQVSFDRFQSTHARQILSKLGFQAPHISVDKTDEAYIVLRSTIYEGRLSVYDYEPFFTEIALLIHDVVKKKVDHPDGGCFVGCTRIPLLNGTHPTIEELSDFGDVWVYSCRESGLIVPGLGRARKTKEVTELVDVVLDSGAVERCTPEHRWMLRDGTYKPAKDLRPGIDRLMPINRQWPVNGGYERVSNRVGDNHKVREVIPVREDHPVPVYDLEVDEFHNFALCSGVFVHNSKDVSDAVAGVVSELTKAMGENAQIRGHSTTSELTPPQPVQTLMERLEESGALAKAVSSATGRIV